jgi:uncharacterized protein (DUF39 family)
VGPEKAAEKVDVVTTGTFGAMCSSGVWINFGHSDPPFKIAKCWLNDVQGYGGVAAVTALGNTITSCAFDHIEKALDHVTIDGIAGMMAIMGESFSLCDELPTICRAGVDFDLISRGKRREL